MPRSVREGAQCNYIRLTNTLSERRIKDKKTSCKLTSWREFNSTCMTVIRSLSILIRLYIYTGVPRLHNESCSHLKSNKKKTTRDMRHEPPPFCFHRERNVVGQGNMLLCVQCTRITPQVSLIMQIQLVNLHSCD